MKKAGRRRLTGLEVVEQDAAFGGLLAPVADDDAGAVDDLARVAFAVEETGPLAELLAVANLDQRNLMLRAQRLDQLLVGLLLAVLVQDAHVRLAAVERLAGLAQAAGEAVVDEGVAEDALECVFDGHGTFGGGGVGGDFDFVGGLDGGDIFSNVESDVKSSLKAVPGGRFGWLIYERDEAGAAGDGPLAKLAGVPLPRDGGAEGQVDDDKDGDVGEGAVEPAVARGGEDGEGGVDDALGEVVRGERVREQRVGWQRVLFEGGEVGVGVVLDALGEEEDGKGEEGVETGHAQVDEDAHGGGPGFLDAPRLVEPAAGLHAHADDAQEDGLEALLAGRPFDDPGRSITAYILLYTVSIVVHGEVEHPAEDRAGREYLERPEELDGESEGVEVGEPGVGHAQAGEQGYGGQAGGGLGGRALATAQGLRVHLSPGTQQQQRRLILDARIWLLRRVQESAVDAIVSTSPVHSDPPHRLQYDTTIITSLVLPVVERGRRQGCCCCCFPRPLDFLPFRPSLLLFFFLLLFSSALPLPPSPSPAIPFAAPTLRHLDHRQPHHTPNREPRPGTALPFDDAPSNPPLIDAARCGPTHPATLTARPTSLLRLLRLRHVQNTITTISISTTATTATTARHRPPGPGTHSLLHDMTSSVSLPVPLSSSSSSSAVNGISTNPASNSTSAAAAAGSAPPENTTTTTTHPDSDSEAETIVLLRSSRGRSRGSRIPYDDSPDDDRRSRKPNGDSRDSRDSKDARDSNSNSRPSVDDAYSSDLSSAPSSRAPSSKRPLPKDLPRKRTASPSRLTHSPPRRKIQKLHADDDAQKRRSLKRKARDDSIDRPAALDSSDDDADDRRRSPRGIRIKSSPPMSPPPLPSNGKSHHSTRDSHTSTASSASSRPGHARKKSVPHSVAANKSAAAAAASGSTPKPVHKAKRSGGRPAPLHLTNDHSDADVKSTSSSRSNSPGLVNNGNMRSSSNSRRRRPSFSGLASAASPARLIGPGHKMKRDKTGRNQLHKICSKGGLEEAKACLEAEPDLLNDADNAGYLPLHAAALAGHNDIVGWLIDEGAMVDKPAEDLSTPLLDAVENMHIQVVNTLLEHGADPRHRNKAGQSSVDLASTIRQQSDDAEEESKMGLIEDALRAALVKLRNKKRADDEARKIAATESSSSRAASVASPSHLSPPPQSNQISTSSSRRRTGRGEPTRNEFLWLDAGKGGQAKLKQASRDGDMEMAGKLLESGIFPDPESMMLAARGGHLDVLNLLVAFGGDCDPDPKAVVRQHTKDKSQFPLVAGEETPLLATIGRNNIEVLKLLLKSDTMKEPRRLDSRGRSYAEIARQRAGENWEEEVRMLQKVWDDAGPQKSKKSSRERPDSSPVTTRKDREKEKERKTERREVKAEEIKKPKRLRRRSASPAASSAVDDTAPSERERDISPAIARSKLKDLDKQKRRDRAVESDYSAISDSNATVDGSKTTTKKRRLVLGKDLAVKTEKERPKDEKPQSSLRKRSDDADPAEQTRKDKKEKKKPLPEDEDVEMADAPKSKKKIVDSERNIRRDRSLDKRHREGSSSSARPTANDHTPDADVLTRRRKRLEDEADQKGKSKDAEAERPAKSKEERLAERESRRIEATKSKARSEKTDKTPSNDVTKDSEEAAAAALEQRKREKKKRREEALRETAAKEDTPVKRAKERDTVASDIDKKPRSEKDRSAQNKDKEKEKEKDKDAMDIDMDVPLVKRKKYATDADSTTDEPSKARKRKSNGASPAPTDGSRHSELANGRGNRGTPSTRDEVKKTEPNDDAMLTEERERELERQRLEKEKEQREQERKEQERKEQERKKQEAAAAAKALEEKRREQERLEQQRREQERLEQQRREQERLEQERLEKQRLEQERLEKERIEAAIRAKLEEEERRKRLEALRAVEKTLTETSLSQRDAAHRQSLTLHAENYARFDELRRIERLPYVYRCATLAEDKEAFARSIWDDFRGLMPLYVLESSESWVSNAQACLILGFPHDLALQKYCGIERRPVTAAVKESLKNNMHPVFASFGLPRPLDFDVEAEWERQEIERSKFLALDTVFLLKVSDLYAILHSDDRYRFILDKHTRGGKLPTAILAVDD
ncbi:hypothetical protein Dda_6437 [Drechslerella dactyloides]|uniref:Uncharacterized protein n=1 Tax=Drechslerella dactyloides TaxID=74499 RepID=A0AAD6NHJ2_DREDA|nr:hypothetical protein Dda_6437 [Drechslerella dactyloides]